MVNKAEDKMSNLNVQELVMFREEKLESLAEANSQVVCCHVIIISDYVSGNMVLNITVGLGRCCCWNQKHYRWMSQDNFKCLSR